MPNIYDPNFNKNVVEVYTEEAGFTGFKGLEWNKLDEVESLLRNTSNKTNVDAFGRLRTSQLYNLNDYSFIYGGHDLIGFLSLTQGTGSSVIYDGLKAKAILTVGTGVNDFAYNQSRKYHVYRPGKSQLILSSFNFGSPRSGTWKRIGYYDDYNGIFAQQSGDGTLQFVFRSNVSGYVYDEVVPQINWNIDPCNGTGPSNFNFDQTKTQLFYSDFQWLGVGRVRAGFVHNGQTIVAHEFYNSNYKENVYWSNPALPVRAAVRNYSATTGTTSMSQICATVISEGGSPDVGFDFGIKTTGAAGRTIALNSTLPMLAIKMKTGFNGFTNRGFVSLNQVNGLTTAEAVSWEVWKLPNSGSILGGSWVSANNESIVEYNSSATGYYTTSGYMMDASFIPGGGQGAGQFGGASSLQNLSNTRLNFIAQNIEGNNSDLFAVLFTNLGTSNSPGSTRAYAAFQWREIK